MPEMTLCPSSWFCWASCHWKSCAHKSAMNYSFHLWCFVLRQGLWKARENWANKKLKRLHVILSFLSQHSSKQPTEEGYLWDFWYLIKLGEGGANICTRFEPIGSFGYFAQWKMRSSTFLSFFIMVWSYLNLIPPSKLFASSVKFFLWCADDVANVAYLSRQ